MNGEYKQETDKENNVSIWAFLTKPFDTKISREQSLPSQSFG